ncbi:Gfo/Idh/MocA family protein [Paenilisteria rocourtiae]|uniref:Putative dehydrogenase n=1 Tax=Listeria rocourtiae TaxID=647910 RepID=A0A4R6ZPT5_9LIST|nr:Gfo/Idh/MocA family oxidoreductase [Listeria rocourtiae]MBC1435763.1 Gfo/Idh/MocA family oxidoreductase [Listeria rocourtiae]MBC1604073.1 Gfo/Idh/MocA family oxidoreductase [Listeria rocourtiae]TDR54587.1 putative dehydrogenase [Listeria rocourtiae]
MKNLVIVGFGGMGTYHVELVSAADGITVTGAYDISSERMQVATEKGLETYQSFEAVLADEKVDAILIATPNDSHKDLAIQALEAGKNVVCEKPVTITSADLEAILTVAKKENQIFMVHQNRRWDADFLIVRDMMQKEAKIGNVFHIESRVQGANGIPGDWRHLKAQGGGMVLDWGVHLLDQLLFMTDSRIKTVSANLSYILGNEVDDGFTSIIQFENGLTALMEVGTTNYVKLPRWYVKGTEGTAVITDWDLSGEIVGPNRDVAKVEPKPIQAGQGLTKTMAPPSEESTTHSPIKKIEPDMSGFYDNFAAVLNGEAEPIVKNEEVHRVLRLIEAIFEAGEQQKVVHFQE